MTMAEHPRRTRLLSPYFCLSAGLLVALILVACNRPRDSSEPDAVVLRVLMAPDATGVWRDTFDDFHAEHPGIRIQPIEGPSATNTREDLYVTSFLSGQNVYDLVFADVPWIPKFAAAGWLEDLTGYWGPEDWNRFIAGSITGGSYRNRIFRLPTQMNGGVLFYRKDLLEQAGEAPPETFADLVRISTELQHPDKLWGFVWQGKQYEGLVCDYLEVLVGHGGFWIDPETGRVGLDRPEARAALQFMVDCIHRWKISPPGVTTYTEEESRQLFHAGRAIFHRNWPYVWSLAQKPDSPIRGRVGMVPMPRAPGGTSASTLGGWGFAIAKSCRHKREAWEFLKFMTRLKVIERIYGSTGAEPALKEFYQQSDDPVLHSIYRVLQKTVPRPPVPQYAQASDILQRYVSAALTQDLTPEAALERAARETRLLMGTSE